MEKSLVKRIQNLEEKVSRNSLKEHKFTPEERAHSISYVFSKHFIKGDFEINSSGLVDVYGDVVLDYRFYQTFDKDISEFCEFGTIHGNFKSEIGYIKTLKGFPKKVTGNFSISSHKIRTLRYAPEEVGGDYDCQNCQLTSLVGAPKKISGNFICQRNNLTSLIGAPNIILGDFDCSYNNLEDLVGGPKRVDGDFNCLWNPLESLEGRPKILKGKLLILKKQNRLL